MQRVWLKSFNQAIVQRKKTKKALEQDQVKGHKHNFTTDTNAWQVSTAKFEGVTNQGSAPIHSWFNSPTGSKTWTWGEQTDARGGARGVPPAPTSSKTLGLVQYHKRFGLFWLWADEDLTGMALSVLQRITTRQPLDKLTCKLRCKNIICSLRLHFCLNR